MSTPLYQVSKSTLNDLVVCARALVGQVKGDAVVAVANAIREAEAEIARAEAPAQTPAEAPKE